MCNKKVKCTKQLIILLQEYILPKLKEVSDLSLIYHYSHKIRSDRRYAQYHSVGVFVSNPDRINTKFLIQRAWCPELEEWGAFMCQGHVRYFLPQLTIEMQERLEAGLSPIASVMDTIIHEHCHAIVERRHARMIDGVYTFPFMCHGLIFQSYYIYYLLQFPETRELGIKYFREGAEYFSKYE